MSRLEGKVLVAQGGGPTAVINQSLVGVVLEARRFRHVTRVYGALHGVRGIINEDFVDLTSTVAGAAAASLGAGTRACERTSSTQRMRRSTRARGLAAAAPKSVS